MTAAEYPVREPEESPAGPLPAWLQAALAWRPAWGFAAGDDDLAAREHVVRLRIFFVLVIFCVGFVTLALFATRAALFSGLDAGGRGAGRAPMPAPTSSTATARCWPSTCCATASTSSRRR